MGKTRAKNVVVGQQAVNLKRRLYWSEQLGLGEITNFYDSDAQELLDEEGAATAVVKIHERCWLSIDLRDFATSPAH